MPSERHDSEEAFVGLADIVCNLMAIFVLLVVIVLVVKSQSTLEGEHDGRDEEASDLFAEPAWDPFPPFQTFVVMMGRDAAILDLAEIADTLASQPPAIVELAEVAAFRESGETQEFSEENALGWTISGRLRRGQDIDSYAIELDLGSEIPADARLGEGPDAIIVTVLEVARLSGTVPSFIVYPDAIGDFVPVHADLIERGVCVRWEVWDYETPFRRVRGSVMGERRCAEAVGG